MERTQFAQEVFKNIQELIRFIDQKAGAVVVIYGFMLVVFIEFAKGLSLVKDVSDLSIPSILTFVFGFIFVTIFVYQLYIILFRIIKPRPASHYQKGEQSLLYFGHIKDFIRTQYAQNLRGISEDEMLNEYSLQIYEVSVIMDLKQRYFHLALKYLYGDAVSLLAFIVFSILLKN